MRRVPLALATGVALLVGAGVVASRDPIATSRALGRARLRLAGLRPHRVRGPRGPMLVFEGGDGPCTVLLAHGYGDEAAHEAAIAAPLARHARVVLPDLPGHGTSAPTGGDELSLDDWVAALDALVAREERPVVLVGSSLGGWAGTLLAARDPGRLAALVLVHAAGLVRSDREHLLLARDREETRALFREMAPWPVHLPPWVADALSRHLRTPRLQALHADTQARAATLPLLPHLALPVHLVWGDGDGFFPVEVAQAAAARLPHAVLHRVGPGGHVPQLLRPAQVVRAVRAVLADVHP